MSNTISIITINCQGIGSPEKRKDVIQYYKQKNFNILCLQDNHFNEKDENKIEIKWGFKCISNSFSSNSRGVAILINNNIEFKIKTIKKDERWKI
ncbi:hypothetical protein LOTGIDRAFT_119738 [Lottia gigantea]|uniref:Endonuclease/exonuclease/phosphatase domain-containing protein n=1 Tax=Lottia gigantea TaxID=225164 RepID=V4AD05_LOTGI|nr:hypothetical protein LOTGIDRAFT_119738 [Lottia gigantea]ESO92980.1 hypothetical protein LOTGIDRAFT_119738 [Lottia gigantea]